jgi:hypothetical protein
LERFQFARKLGIQSFFKQGVWLLLIIQAKIWQWMSWMKAMAGGAVGGGGKQA